MMPSAPPVEGCFARWLSTPSLRCPFGLRRRALGSALAFFIGLGSQFSATAAPPANDNFSTGLSGTFFFDKVDSATRNGTNVDATLETGGGEVDPSGSGGASVWWKVRIKNDATWVVIDTIGSAFDTILYVFQGGSLGALSYVAGNDDYDANTA
ncbi:MAG: hypothetical protein ACC661_03150, partial [Verrucomicrobiales bacterium]